MCIWKRGDRVAGRHLGLCTRIQQGQALVCAWDLSAIYRHTDLHACISSNIFGYRSTSWLDTCGRYSAVR